MKQKIRKRGGREGEKSKKGERLVELEKNKCQLVT